MLLRVFAVLAEFALSIAEPPAGRGAPVSAPPFDVVGLGAAVVDLLALVPRFPERDSKQAVMEMSRQGGGLVGTALVALARLGARTRYVGRLGDDEASAWILAEFAREGVDTTAVARVVGEEARVSIVIVEAESGLRTILHPGHARAAVDPASLAPETFLAARSLLVDTTDPPAALQCAAWMREAGRPTLIDADQYSPEAHAVALACDHVVASHRYATACTGRRPRRSPARWS